MSFYARPSLRLVGQVAADALVVAWVAGWWLISRFVDGTIRGLAGPVRQTAQTASDLKVQLQDAAGRVGNLPAVGGDLRQPFDAMASTLEGLSTSAAGQAAGLVNTATLVGAAIFVLPVLSLVALWLPARLRFAARSSDLRALAATPHGTDLLALRALAGASVSELARVHPDPVAAWRSGDPGTIAELAALELDRAGVGRPRSPGILTR